MRRSDEWEEAAVESIFSLPEKVEVETQMNVKRLVEADFTLWISDFFGQGYYSVGKEVSSERAAGPVRKALP